MGRVAGSRCQGGGPRAPAWSLWTQLFLVAFACFSASGCGRKTTPRVPELVRPMPVGEVSAEVSPDGVELSWRRPRVYVDGSKMDDLEGFKVFRAELRASGAFPSFSEIATVPVVDRDKFRQARRFHFLDSEIKIPANYLYRVVAFTTDHYYSEASTSKRVELKVAP